MIVEPEEGKTLNFIEQIIEEEIAAGKNGEKYIPVSRRSRMDIYISDMLLQYVSISGWLQNIMGACNLRFDDTNPSKEDVEFTDAIQEDIKWLGFQWDGPVRYASDYFQQLYDWAEQMILEGRLMLTIRQQKKSVPGKTITEPE